ncbi:MAG: acyl-CoA dehydrogenase family protein, partial [Candidatus Puniceispirillaceae bacterium]
MQFGLTEEQELIVSTVRSFVETEIYPFEDEIEARGDVPAEIGQQIKDKVLEMGFYAA